MISSSLIWNSRKYIYRCCRIRRGCRDRWWYLCRHGEAFDIKAIVEGCVIKSPCAYILFTFDSTYCLLEPRPISEIICVMLAYRCFNLIVHLNRSPHWLHRRDPKQDFPFERLGGHKRHGLGEYLSPATHASVLVVTPLASHKFGGL